MDLNMDCLIDRIEEICRILNGKQLPSEDNEKLLAELELLILDVKHHRQQRDKKLNIRL